MNEYGTKSEKVLMLIFVMCSPKKVSKKNNRIVKHDNMNCDTRIKDLDSQMESWPMWCHL